MGTVLLAGAFGQANAGDEALLQAFQRALADWTIVATSVDPQETTRRHGSEAVASHDLRGLLKALRRADAVVIGGGTVFKALHASTGRAPHELLRNATLLAFAARSQNKPVLLVGVGAGSLSSGRERRLARRLVQQSDLLVMRDEASARVLSDAGVPPPFRVGADPTWTLLDRPRSLEPGSDDVAVVTVSRYAGTPELASRLAGALRRARDRGLRICVQPWQIGSAGGDDLALTHAIASQAGGPVELLDPPRDLCDAIELVERARIVIGMRFHSLVAAAAAGTRFLAVDHEAKLGALATRFEQAAVRPTEGPECFAAGFDRAMSSAAPSASVARAQVALAEEGFRLLRLVLDDGRTLEPAELTGLPLEPELWR